MRANPQATADEERLLGLAGAAGGLLVAYPGLHWLLALTLNALSPSVTQTMQRISWITSPRLTRSTVVTGTAQTPRGYG